jgi:pyridoxamine 5'-phosphate oxidase
MIKWLRGLFTGGRGVLAGLPTDTEDRDPVALFSEWFEQARRGGIYLPEAITLSTASPDGAPSARMVLLKRYGEDGFVFFTNYESRKATELEANPRAALVAYWPKLHRQVRIEGTVSRVTEEESYAYFKTRPRGSRIGAWASSQSRVLEERGELEKRVAEFEAKFKGADVPLPPNWGGYRVTPARMEFWQGRASRLHDRVLFTRKGDVWEAVRLFP